MKTLCGVDSGNIGQERGGPWARVRTEWGRGTEGGKGVKRGRHGGGGKGAAMRAFRGLILPSEAR